MSHAVTISWVAGCMQLIVAAYALRLNRLFGMARVGWSLFCSFALLALLHLIQSARMMDADTQLTIQMDGLYFLISFLLLTGLLHIETLLKERLKMEGVERELRAELESRVKQKTAHLTRAIDELVSEIEERKKIQTQFDRTQQELLAASREEPE